MNGNDTLRFFMGTDKPMLSESQIAEIIEFIGEDWPHSKGYAQEKFNERYVLQGEAWVPRELVS